MQRRSFLKRLGYAGLVLGLAPFRTFLPSPIIKRSPLREEWEIDVTGYTTYKTTQHFTIWPFRSLSVEQLGKLAVEIHPPIRSGFVAIHRVVNISPCGCEVEVKSVQHEKAEFYS